MKQDNNYVGILNDNPSVALEVGGALTASGTIRSQAGFRFPDNTIQSTAVSLPSYLFTPIYFKVFLVGTLTNSYTQTKMTFFTGNNQLNIGSFTYTSSDITIPVDGVYEIHYNIHARSVSSASRQSPKTHIRVNDALVAGRKEAILCMYLRNGSGGSNYREMSASASTILSLNQNDTISLWAEREGTNGSPVVQTGSHI